MRVLVDQCVPKIILETLTAMGHVGSEHVSNLGQRKEEDVVLFEVAKQYDIFLTADIHRQVREWTALVQGLIQGEIKILRIMLSKDYQSLPQEIEKSLKRRQQIWEQHFVNGMCLVLIKNKGATIRARTREEALAML